MTAPPLARSTLDRAAHRRTDPTWLAGAWSRARVLVVDGGRALIREAGGDVELVFVDASSVPDGTERLFLGVDEDDTPVFAVAGPLPELAGAREANLREANLREANLREVGDRLSDRDAGIMTTAVALAQWHARHRYSPLTGTATTASDGGWVRVDEAGGQYWPRTDPAVIVLVHDGEPGPGGRCLLGHNVAWTLPPQRFSCLAGFVEPGESAEATVVREVAEEVGVKVSRVTYVGSQSWPFPGSLMLGFTAYADADQPVRTDQDEIAEARWFSRQEIAAVLAGTDASFGLPMPASIAYHLITRWLRGR